MHDVRCNVSRAEGLPQRAGPAAKDPPVHSRLSLTLSLLCSAPRLPAPLTAGQLGDARAFRSGGHGWISDG